MTADKKDAETETSRPASSGHYHGRTRAGSTVMEKRSMTPKPLNPPGERIARRQGGLKGGKARAEKLSPERRREIAVNATRTRWAKKAIESVRGRTSHP